MDHGMVGPPSIRGFFFRGLKGRAGRGNRGALRTAGRPHRLDRPQRPPGRRKGTAAGAISTAGRSFIKRRRGLGPTNVGGALAGGETGRPGCRKRRTAINRRAAERHGYGRGWPGPSGRRAGLRACLLQAGEPARVMGRPTGPTATASRTPATWPNRKNPGCRDHRPTGWERKHAQIPCAGPHRGGLGGPALLSSPDRTGRSCRLFDDEADGLSFWLCAGQGGYGIMNGGLHPSGRAPPRGLIEGGGSWPGRYRKRPAWSAPSGHRTGKRNEGRPWNIPHATHLSRASSRAGRNACGAACGTLTPASYRSGKPLVARGSTARRLAFKLETATPNRLLQACAAPFNQILLRRAIRQDAGQNSAVTIIDRANSRPGPWPMPRACWACRAETFFRPIGCPIVKADDESRLFGATASHVGGRPGTSTTPKEAGPRPKVLCHRAPAAAFVDDGESGG